MATKDKVNKKVLKASFLVRPVKKKTITPDFSIYLKEKGEI